ncbi:hypothetical protein CLV99_3248 [Sphingobacterium yanglingense]|uniref:Uncharacterized protein n=2 Tax=Sphingobacterium yanglingense TaxID=1437280 RepID=A0A4R6WB82_9SPHI|nr:hypothetical protein CLV99_3248 [Sphingobacterium yanglingense]
MTIFIRMENLLVVLIFVGSIVYKIYSNYKEEMEKSAKRGPQRPPITKSQAPGIPGKPYQQSSVPPPIPSTTARTVQQEFVTKGNIIQDIPEEVQRVKESRKKHGKGEVEPTKETNEPIAFDLRQAVIQAAILERPYR